MRYNKCRISSNNDRHVEKEKFFNALRQKGKNARHKITFEDNIRHVKCLRIPYENERQMHDTHCVAYILHISSVYTFILFFRFYFESCRTRFIFL